MAMLEVRNSDNQAEQVKARATFQTTLDEFQFKAPVGSFKIDIIIKQLNAKRGTTVDVVEMRKGLWRAAYLSAMDAHHTKHEHPAWVREATNYIENLRSARAALAAASMADIGHMCRTLRFIPNDPSDLASHLQYQNVKREFEQLNADMQRAHLRLSEYLDRNVLPEYKPPANAADHFMRSFLALAAAAVWAEKFGRFERGTALISFASLQRFWSTSAMPLQPNNRKMMIGFAGASPAIFSRSSCRSVQKVISVK